MEPILRFVDVSKIYGGVKALNHVSLDLMPGEILALCGENGAGKSTLIKSLSGAVIPDDGKIIVDGKEYTELNPKLSKDIGVATVYQELTLCRGLTVYENIFLGQFKGNGVIVDSKQMIKEAQSMLDDLHINISSKVLVSELTTAYMQLVEIVKAVSRNAKILVLDEPTASLTAAETDFLFDLVKKLKKQGTSIIYISHKLSEVFELADRVAILRDGEVVDVKKIEDLTEETLTAGMIGRTLSKTFPQRDFKHSDDVVLKVHNICNEKVRNISFELRKGEVLGFGGLVGAGRTETMRSIFGADPIFSGEVYLNGKKVKFKNPREAVNAGIAMVPEDRKILGAILPLSIQNNVCLGIYEKISKLLFVNSKTEKNTAKKMIERLQIKTPSEELTAGSLSGGNQQKVVLGKCIATNANILIFDEPTKGIDVGAKHEFYKLINELAKDGMSIIMISSEMDELLGMSDRIVVLSEGKLAGTLEKEEFSQENVFHLATVNLQ